jgi:hypothetical protein
VKASHQGEDRADAVAVAGQERDVDEQPDHPDRKSRELDRPGRDDGLAAGCAVDVLDLAEHQ